MFHLMNIMNRMIYAFFLSFHYQLVEWLHDSRPIDSDLQTQSTSNRQFKLTVSSIREKDVGQYTVRLTNKKGVTTTLAFALVIIKE